MLRAFIYVLFAAGGLAGGFLAGVGRGYAYGYQRGTWKTALQYEQAAISRSCGVPGTGLTGEGPFRWIVKLDSTQADRFPNDVFLATDEATAEKLFGAILWRLDKYWPASRWPADAPLAD